MPSVSHPQFKLFEELVHGNVAGHKSLAVEHFAGDDQAVTDEFGERRDDGSSLFFVGTVDGASGPPTYGSERNPVVSSLEQDRLRERVGHERCLSNLREHGSAEWREPAGETRRSGDRDRDHRPEVGSGDVPPGGVLAVGGDFNGRPW